MLTYSFDKVSKNAAELELTWDKKQFPVKIEFDVDKIVMDNAAQELKVRPVLDGRLFQRGKLCITEQCQC